MDFSINSKQNNLSDMEKQVPQNIDNEKFESKASFQETESKENNNLNSLKTENEINNSFQHGSLLLEIVNGKVKNPDSFYKYTNNKKVTDLNIHDTILKRRERTIFDDAEYFSKNYSYKLLPITFENVNEMIIHSEHNYCNLSLSSESEAEKDCSRTMDYKQVKEKNYKKRKSKFKDDIINQNLIKSNFENEKNIVSITMNDNKLDKSVFHTSNLKNNSLFHPLHLSAPLVQDEKTEKKGGEDTNVNEMMIINNKKNDTVTNNDEWEETKRKKDRDYSGQFDSDKEKKLKKNLIEVTITRNDSKNNYQPCDSFLNDIARLVPKIVEKNCSEIDILDYTCDSYVDFENHRLYYVISESTWQLFQNANERVILTNDRSLGQPIQNQEKNERPTFLVFDQYSLAKCLADYCRKIGGCFEYKFVEEENEGKINVTEKFSQKKKAWNGENIIFGNKPLGHSVFNNSDEVPPCEKSEELVDDKDFSLKNDLIKISPENSCEFVNEIHKNCLKNENQQAKECEVKNLLGLVKQNVVDDKASEKGKIKKSVQDSKISFEDFMENNSSEKCHNNIDKIKEYKEQRELENFCKTALNKLTEKSNDVKKTQGSERKKKIRTKQASKNKIPAEKSLEIYKETAKNKKIGRGSKLNFSASDVSPQIHTRESLHLRKKTLAKSNDGNLKKLKTAEKLSMRTRSKSTSKAETKKLEFCKTVTSQKKSDNIFLDTSKKGIKQKHGLPERFRKPTCKNGKMMEKSAEGSKALIVKEDKRRTRSETSSLNVINKNFNRSNKNNSFKNNLNKNKGAKNDNCRKSNEPSVKVPVLKVIKKANRKIEDSKKINSEKRSLRYQVRNVTAAKSCLKNLKINSEGTLKERRKRKREKERNQSKELCKRPRRH